MESTKVLDAKGLACPMPIVKTKKEINELKSGEVLEIHVTDKGAKNDLTAWSKSSGHELIKHEVVDDHILKFWIRKG
ncbi:sulfurtransferase TusA family protein [Bacillus sp. JJ664]